MATPGNFRALMAIRPKRGETTAVTALTSRDHVANLQVLVDLDPWAAMGTQRDNIVALVRQLDSLGRPPMVDVVDVAQPGQFDGGPARLLGDLVDDLTADLFPSTFIPVVRGDATDEYSAFIGRLCGELGAGAALRVRPTATGHADPRRVVDRLDLSPDDVDLVLDWRYVAEVDPRLTESVVTLLDRIEAIAHFRSATLLSGSVPPAMKQTASWNEPRWEENLWRAVCGTAAPHLRFGDYGVVHPIPGQGFPSRHVTVKYTCPDRWLYLRERMNGDAEDDPGDNDSPRAHTLRIVCRNLATCDSYAGPAFSWGDREIRTAADGGGSGLGHTSKPVAIGTSHHLAYLAGMAAA